MGEGQLASHSNSKSEVVLLQASNSFFAHEPILKALQRLTMLPFSGYLIPALMQPGKVELCHSSSMMPMMNCVCASHKSHACAPDAVLIG